jgi:aspartyl-tRNA(Asn)/glutamyl-tRNA(Gln) amidotransferase subunit A
MASSSDTIGALASSVDDVALVMEVMSGKDALDSTTIDIDDKEFSKPYESSEQVKIGVIKEYLAEGVDKEVKQRITEAIDKLDKNGAIISEVSLPSLPLALAAYYILCPAEVSSNLSRYDGQRFGYSDKDAKTMEDSYFNSRSTGFGAEAKRRIMIGTYVLSSGYYDAYYKRAQTVRTKIINEFNQALKNVDFLVGPTSSTAAFKVGEFASDPLAMYLNDIMTVASSLAGIPTITLPVGKDSQGLPVGMQLMAAQKQDKKLLNYAREIEELINV